MCGFAGLLNNGFAVHRQQVSTVAQQVSFRGPDSCGIGIFDHELNAAETGNNVLFFNRLAIMDLDPRSNQPFGNSRYTLTFNGEIYNYTELKTALTVEGYTFHTTSDTEVLFYALQHWGVDALKKLNGMFAFCWIDKEQRSFLIARDRIGIKPLYYRRNGTSLVFASELDSVLRLSDTPGDIEPMALDMMLWMQFIPSPYSIIKDVFKLPPGHYIAGTWAGLDNNETIQPVAYWDAYTYVADKKQPEQLESILVDSLSRQLIADVPLGLFLSSGVDSSLLAALVNKHFKGAGQFNFFTVAFSETTESDESRDALEFIKGFNNPDLLPHTITIDPKIIGEHLDSLYNYYDEPFGDPTSLLNWVVSKKAREHVTVALSGDGADELFWGYKRYDKWKHPYLQLTERNDKLIIPKSLGGLAKALLPMQQLRSKARLELESDPLHLHFTLFLAPVLEHLTKKPIWENPLWALKNIDKIRDKEDMVAWLDCKTYLPDAMLHKVDRASMAASLEVRVPYLDNVVIDYALGLPLQHKSNTTFKHKAVLKQLLRNLAPHYDINRPKKGFNFPLDKWLRFAWRDKTMQLVTKESLADVGLDADLYLKMLQQYYAGDRKYCIAIWYVLNLMLWHRKFKTITPLRPS